MAEHLETPTADRLVQGGDDEHRWYRGTREDLIAASIVEDRIFPGSTRRDERYTDAQGRLHAIARVYSKRGHPKQFQVWIFAADRKSQHVEAAVLIIMRGETSSCALGAQRFEGTAAARARALVEQAQDLIDGADVVDGATVDAIEVERPARPSHLRLVHSEPGRN